MILTPDEEKHLFSAFEQAMARRGISDKPQEVLKFLVRLLLDDVAVQHAEIDAWLAQYRDSYVNGLAGLDAKTELTRTLLTSKQTEVETFQARVASERGR